MRHGHRHELGEPVGTVPDRDVRGDRTPVVADQDCVGAIARELVGEGQRVERERRDLVAAVGREAGR